MNIILNSLLQGHYISRRRQCEITDGNSLHSTRQAMHANVTLRSVRLTNVAVEKQYVLHILRTCVCSLSHTACNAHALYCIGICGLRISTALFHIISWMA